VSIAAAGLASAWPIWPDTGTVLRSSTNKAPGRPWWSSGHKIVLGSGISQKIIVDG